jgi:hypothetical protein
MKKYATVDDSNFPEVLVTFTGEKADDENFTCYLEEVKATYERKQSLMILFDATKATTPNIKYQKQQADWLKENEHLMHDYCKGTAYIIPNAIIRTVLKGIFAFQTQPVPHKVVKTIEEARAWLASY